MLNRVNTELGIYLNPLCTLFGITLVYFKIELKS